MFSLSAAPARASNEDFGFNARALGMAEAVSADSEDLGSLSLNPASLGHLRRATLDTGLNRLFHTQPGPTDLSGMNAAVGVPITHPSYPGAFAARWSYDVLEPSVAIDRLLGLSYATRSWREIGPGAFDVGITLKALSRTGSAGGSSSKKAAVDLGSRYRWGEGRALGLAILNINNPDTTTGPLRDRAPATLKLGYVQQMRRFTIGIDLTKREPSDGFGASETAAMGVEHAWGTARFGSYSGRSGIILGSHSRSWSLGAGWTILGTQLDYALRIPLAGGSRWSNAVSLSYRFGAWNPEAEYERLLTQEIRYRKELTRALDSSEIKQWKLAEELRLLKEEIEDIRAALAAKEAQMSDSDQRLKAARQTLKLKEVEERRREAQQRFERLQAERERLREQDREGRLREEMAAYQALKKQGVPDLLLIERLKNVLRQFQGQGVDLGEAHRELNRLMKN